MKIRVGMGFDVHRLKEGRKCIIGGVEIPHHAGPGRGGGIPRGPGVAA